MTYGRKEHGHYKEESPKQGLTSAKDLPIVLHEGHESPYRHTNLTYLWPLRAVNTYILNYMYI